MTFAGPGPIGPGIGCRVEREMTASAQGSAMRLLNPWRVIGWGAAAVLLALPAVLRFPWPAFAFVALGVMLAVIGGLIELAAARARTPAHAGAAALALLSMFAFQWVGRVGADEHLENLVYVVVALVALGGAFGARFRAEGLAGAMFFTAGFQLAVALGAYAAGWTMNDARGPEAQLLFNAALALPWLASGVLFRAK
jgi:hypothetical protein